MKSFSELALPEAIQKSLQAMKFDVPTPIQAQAIPVALAGTDIVGNAQTGTGKTAAFCIPLLDKILKDKDCAGLILCPTRELALQIETFWKVLTKQDPTLRAICLIGGGSMREQFRALEREARIVIATPGRLNDHLLRRSITLGHVTTLILDEADRMLDMGFSMQIAQIIKHLPVERQTMLFSATWDQATNNLSKQYLRSPKHISVDATSKAALKIVQQTVPTDEMKKNETLASQLYQKKGSSLIFARTKHRADRVAKYLVESGFKAGRIHGDRTQAQRIGALDDFRAGRTQILVATDIASRGIDVPTIQQVINYDLPQSAEDYIHRIGRTGRAGAEGVAVTLLTPHDGYSWKQILRLLQKSGSSLPAGETPRGFDNNVHAPTGGAGGGGRPRGRSGGGAGGRSGGGGGGGGKRFQSASQKQQGFKARKKPFEGGSGDSKPSFRDRFKFKKQATESSYSRDN